MAAWMYIADSRDKRLCHAVSFHILSSVIQNILDGKYQNSKNAHVDCIHYKGKDQQKWILRANIVGLSLWNADEMIQIFDKDGIKNRIHGAPGDINVLYELYGEIHGANLAEILLITHKRVWPIVLQGTTHEAIMLELFKSNGIGRGKSEPEAELV